MCKTYSKEWIFLKEKKKLNIKGTVLDRYQLEQYLEKIASDHILTEKSAKDTYPIPRLKENFFVIKEIYKLLNEQIKQGIPIHPAGEWILDNLYVIEEIVKNISKELTLKKYTDFLGLRTACHYRQGLPSCRDNLFQSASTVLRKSYSDFLG